MTLTMQAPAVIDADSLTRTPRVELLTCAIGAEVGNVSLAAAARDAGLAAEIRQLLLAHKVLFFRDQQI
jgi:taurine dioxygenase